MLGFPSIDRPFSLIICRQERCHRVINIQSKVSQEIDLSFQLFSFCALVIFNLKFCKVSCDTLPYGGRDHQKVTLGETPTSDRDSTVAYGRPSAPRHSTARHRMECGESNELAHGTVTTVASRDPHPCLSQGPDFSVVLFRSDCMLVSERHPMKMHKNQWLSKLSFPFVDFRQVSRGFMHEVP